MTQDKQKTRWMHLIQKCSPGQTIYPVDYISNEIIDPPKMLSEEEARRTNIRTFANIADKMDKDGDYGIALGELSKIGYRIVENTLSIRMSQIRENNFCDFDGSVNGLEMVFKELEKWREKYHTI